MKRISFPLSLITRLFNPFQFFTPLTFYILFIYYFSLPYGFVGLSHPNLYLFLLSSFNYSFHLFILLSYTFFGVDELYII